MRKAILFLLLVIGLSSCQRSCQKMRRQYQASKRTYYIEVYSGGKLIHSETFNGVITEEEGNGAYYYKGDTLVEISGDYILKSVR